MKREGPHDNMVAAIAKDKISLIFANQVLLKSGLKVLSDWTCSPGKWLTLHWKWRQTFANRAKVADYIRNWKFVRTQNDIPYVKGTIHQYL